MHYFVAYYLIHVVFGLERIDDLMEYLAGHFVVVVHPFAPLHAGRFAAVVSDFAVGRQFAMLGMPVSSIGLHLVGGVNFGPTVH